MRNTAITCRLEVTLEFGGILTFSSEVEMDINLSCLRTIYKDWTRVRHIDLHRYIQTTKLFLQFTFTINNL